MMGLFKVSGIQANADGFHNGLAGVRLGMTTHSVGSLMGHITC